MSIYENYGGGNGRFNGGAQGALHISWPWGDTQFAGISGSGAALYGSEPAADVIATMTENPEPMPYLNDILRHLGLKPLGNSETMVIAADRGTCRQRCEGMNVFAKAGCLAKCAALERTGGEGGDYFGGLLQQGMLLLLAVGIILVGALALTK